MKKTLHRLAVVLLFISSWCMAQQERAYTFYRQHLNLINPAYAGMDNGTVATSTLREQWMGIANAPSTQAVSFGTTLGKNVGFGMTVINDKTFIEKQTGVSVDFSYKLKMSKTADIYFGIRAVGNSYHVNTSGLETYNVQADPALGSISTFNPNVGVGAVYREGSLYVSLSMPRLFNTKKARNDNGYVSVASDSSPVYLSSGGYDIPLNVKFSTLILKPSFMLRYVNGAPVSLDLTAMLQIENNFEIGGMYRTDQAYAAMSTIRLSNRFIVGFAYEMSSRSVLASARNTNEILLQFKF